MSNLNEIKAGPMETGVHELILKRWSPRAFDGTPVSSEELRKLLTAASWAASSYNEQPWRYLIGRKGEAAHDRIFGLLTERNQLWAKKAPVLMLSVAKRTFSKDGNENLHAVHDTGAASANLALQASALGLHAHGMAGFDRDKAREVFTLPPDFDPVAVWAVGRLGDAQSLPEFFKSLELAPRTRKPLQEFVFREWDVPATID